MAPCARADDASAGRRHGFGLLVVSVALLAYEVTQLRIFAYSLDPVLVLLGVSITMLGFGVAGTVLSLSDRLSDRHIEGLAGLSCCGFVVSGVAANVAFGALSPMLVVRPASVALFGMAALAVVLLSMIPYAFGGLVVALLLSKRSDSSGRLYFANLLGSGLGCFAVSFALRPLGAERLLLVVFALAALGGAVLSFGEGRRARLACLALASVACAALPIGPRLFAFKPDSGDQLAIMTAAARRANAHEPVLEFGAWDPVARVEVHGFPGQSAQAPHPIPFKMLTQDGGAASVLLGIPADPERGARIFGASLYSAAVQLRPRARTLVIGVGGGPDVQAALHHGASRVVAVEINQATLDAVRTRFAGFLGDPLGSPKVEVVRGDGRSFVRRARERFDVIQMSGVDTLTLQSSGSFVLAEEYLYTVEAFEDYLRALDDRGLLSIIRFGREPVRLAAIAAAALRRHGVTRPEDHVVVLAQSFATLVLVGRSPFTREEIAMIDLAVKLSPAANAGIGVPAYDALGIRLGAPLVRAYAPHLTPADPVLHETLRTTLSSQQSRLALPTDDAPYYFIAEWMGYFKGEEPGPLSAVVALYVRFTLVLSGVALVLVLLPPAIRRWRGVRPSGTVATAVSFFTLGFCYMLLEIGLIQKAVLVVEHPSYSVAVVLASLLISSALGSLVSQRLRAGSPRPAILTAIAITLVGSAFAFFSGPIFSALMALPFALRMVLVALVIVPLGAPMGVLFPLGLRRLGTGEPRLLPWAIATNGFASVLGSVLSVPVAVIFGFTTLVLLASGAYLVAGLAFLFLPGASRR